MAMRAEVWHGKEDVGSCCVLVKFWYRSEEGRVSRIETEVKARLSRIKSQAKMSTQISSQVLAKLNKLIQDEDDLSNLDTLISDISKEQSTIDSQLKIEQERHLQQIHMMISSMQSANKNLQDLKYSVGKLDELRRDNLSNVNKNNDFVVFDHAALVMKNINATEEVYNNIATFHQNQKTIMRLLNDEITKDENGELPNSTGDNLLIAHYHLTKLRDLQDQMELMSRNSILSNTKSIVYDLSLQLGECVKKFDHLLSIIVDSVLDFVETGNFGFLIKVIKIIQYEEREDLKVRLWNYLIDKKNNTEHSATANLNDSRMTKVKRSSERGYKAKFEQIFKKSIEDRFIDILSSKDLSIFLGEQGTFYYQTISDYKTAVTKCFPEEWNFFPKILEWHQEAVRDIVNSILDSGEFSNQQLAQIIDLDYENKQILKQTFKISNKEIKGIRLLSEDKKKQLLNSSLQENISSTTKWIDTALEKAVARFESLSEEPSDRREDRLSFQVSQDVMLILSSNTKNIRTLGDASVLVQYFGFFANDIMRKYQDIWVSALDKMTKLWVISRMTDAKAKGKMLKGDEQVNENIGYLPRYITNLSNDCLILTDALERDFDSITSGLNEVHTHKLLELKQVATNHSIELGAYCLQKLSSLALEDYGLMMNDLFTKSWYKSSTIIDSVLNVIDEEYLMPFIDFSYPELLVSLFDFITDDFLLRYLSMLNYRRSFEKKIVDSLERDGHKIMDVLQKHDEDGILENKMIILDILIELISSANETEYVEKWGIALGEIYDLPVDLLKVVLECKKEDKSRITFILGECTELCKQSMTEHIDEPPTIFRKFHYAPLKK